MAVVNHNNKQNNHNTREFQRMKEKAIKQAQEMHSKAYETPAKENGSPADNGEADLQRNEYIKHTDVSSNKYKEKSVNIIDTLLEDKERTLILLLILILSGEECDISLILALMYLII